MPQYPFDDKSTLVHVMAQQHQAIIWANADPDLCRHMTSLGRNELTRRLLEISMAANLRINNN